MPTKEEDYVSNSTLGYLEAGAREKPVKIANANREDKKTKHRVLYETYFFICKRRERLLQLFIKAVDHNYF